MDLPPEVDEHYDDEGPDPAATQAVTPGVPTFERAVEL
jgi:hypothetical protein